MTKNKVNGRYNPVYIWGNDIPGPGFFLFFKNFDIFQKFLYLPVFWPIFSLIEQKLFDLHQNKEKTWPRLIFWYFDQFLSYIVIFGIVRKLLNSTCILKTIHWQRIKSTGDISPFTYGEMTSRGRAFFYFSKILTFFKSFHICPYFDQFST